MPLSVGAMIAIPTRGRVSFWFLALKRKPCTQITEKNILNPSGDIFQDNDTDSFS